jgi:hypothetical protein
MGIRQGLEPVAAILPRAWAQLLGRGPGSGWSPSTFEDPVHPEQARSDFGPWLARLHRERRPLGFFDPSDGLARGARH